MPAIPAITEATGLYKNLRGTGRTYPRRPGGEPRRGAPHLRRARSPGLPAGPPPAPPGVVPRCWSESASHPRSTWCWRSSPSSRAGGAYLPLDPEYPAERLRFMARTPGRRDRHPGAVPRSLHREDLGARPPGRRRRGDRPLRGRAAAARRGWCARRQRRLRHLHSGSTGRPKGVVVSHREVLRLFAATAPWFRFTAGDVWTLFHSYAFDFSVWELWGAAPPRRPAVVVPRWLARAPDAFQALLAREGVTVLNQTPSAFYALIEADRAADAGAAESLRAVVFGRRGARSRTAGALVRAHGERTKLGQHVRDHRDHVHVTYRPLGALDRGDGRQPDLACRFPTSTPTWSTPPSSRRHWGCPASSPSAAPASRAATSAAGAHRRSLSARPLERDDPVHASTARVTCAPPGGRELQYLGHSSPSRDAESTERIGRAEVFPACRAGSARRAAPPARDRHDRRSPAPAGGAAEPPPDRSRVRRRIAGPNLVAQRSLQIAAARPSVVRGANRACDSQRRLGDYTVPGDLRPLATAGSRRSGRRSPPRVRPAVSRRCAPPRMAPRSETSIWRDPDSRSATR